MGEQQNKRKEGSEQREQLDDNSKRDEEPQKRKS